MIEMFEFKKGNIVLKIEHKKDVGLVDLSEQDLDDLLEVIKALNDFVIEDLNKRMEALE